MLRKHKALIAFFLLLFTFSVFIPSLFSAEKIAKYIPDADVGEQGMTLWQIIVAGGEVMVVLAFLSIAALGLIIYYFITIQQDKLFPVDFQDKVVTMVEENNYEQALRLCTDNQNLIANVFLAGLSRKDREKVIIKEAIEDEGRRGIDDIRQKLSYLADVAAISPMVGLLGTVLGMIQAFNVIAFQTGAVKPILLASGISKAMVTTATGLIIAIPAMIFYSFFRGKVLAITARLENVSTEMFHLITER